ncbi:MAG: hypothetical protein EPN82_13975 [Bacteroidetes bacterium]|nr:MAG: hypothetical protein EPN82_13975 [Bacteroidota bacterium]
MKLLFRHFIVFVLFLIFTLTTFGQVKKKQDTPLLPTAQMHTEVGAFFGIGENIQSGIFKTDTCKCDFVDGRGFGFTIGGLYESELVRNLFWGSALAFDLKSFWSSFKEREPIDFIKDSNKYQVPVWFRYKADASIWYMTLMPYLKYLPAKFMFLRLGLGASFVISSKLNFTKELLDRTGRISTGEIVNVRLDSSVSSDGIHATFINGELPKVNSTQLSLEPAIGFTFPIGEKFRFSPLFQYSVPFANITESGEKVKLSSWRLLLELRYDITPEE